MVFGSCELQKWAQDSKNTDETDFDTEVTYDSNLFETKQDFNWPSIKKQDGRLLFVNTIAQPFPTQYYLSHKDLLY